MEMSRRYSLSTPLLVGISMGLLFLAVLIFAIWLTLAPTQQTVFSIMPGPNFGVVVDPGLEVVEVEPGGGAEKGGLQSGDKLEKVDGQPVTTPAEAMDKLRDKRLHDQSVTVTVRRNGKSLDLTLKPETPKGRPGGPTATPVPNNFGYF